MFLYKFLQLKKIILIIIVLSILVGCRTGRKRSNRVSIDPFVSLQSNKAIKGEVGKKDEEESYKERLTYGIKFNVDLFWIISSEFLVAYNNLESQIKARKAVDEFDEIDYEEDLGIDKTDQDLLLKVKEERRMGRAALKANIGLGRFFTAFAKAGVQAIQRIVTVKYTDPDYGKEAPDSYTTPYKYKPYAGAGFRVRLSRMIQAGATYDFFFYKFPEYTPFTREVGVFFRVNI